MPHVWLAPAETDWNATFGRAASWAATASSASRTPGHFARDAVMRETRASHPKQIAQLEEEPVRRAAQVAEPERFRFRERRAVTKEDDGSRGRLVGKQDVVAEIVGDDGSRRVAVHEQRLPAARIAQRDLILREVLADVAHENGARQLVLELEPGDVGGEKTAAVARAREALVHPARLEPERRRGAQGGGGGHGDLVAFGGLGEDRHRRIAHHHAARYGPVRRARDERRAGEVVQVVRHDKGRRAGRVARVVRGLEADMIQAERDLRLPAAAQVRDQEGLQRVLDGAAQAAEVRVTPDRRESQDRGELLDQRTGAAVPAEAVVGATRDEVGAVPEPARVLEALLDPEQLEMVAVRATGAGTEGDGPQLTGAAAARHPRPRARDLHLGEPDLAPHDVGIDAQHAVIVVAVDAIGVGHAEGGWRSEVATH